MISTSPTQKVGREKPRMEPVMMRRDSRLSAFSPAYSPSGMPQITDRMTAQTASSMVAGSRCRITRSAGSL